MNSDITTAIVLDKRSSKKDGKYPVKLRITYGRVPRVFGISQFLTKRDYSFLTEDELKKVYSDKPRGKFKDMLLEYSAVEQKAKNIVEALSEFSFQNFRNRFLQKSSNLRNIYHTYDTVVKNKEDAGRVGTAENYKGSLSSLKKFSKNDEFLDISKITVSFLERFEKWMSDTQGNSVGTIGMRMRPLRAIFNIALKEGLIKPEEYPFGKGKYQIPAKRNKKKALKIEDIEKIFKYKTKKFSIEDFAKDMWIMSYLCNGANIKDIANLRYKNMDSETITFVRAKTEKNKKEQEDIVVPLIDKIKKLIQKWGNKLSDPEDYIFPMLEPGLTPKQEYYRIQRFVKKVNKHMKDIGNDLGIDKKVTTYVARHSFSTVLKRAGASTELIKESLEHSSIKTTEEYLDSFELEVKKEFATKLMDFKNGNNEELSE